MRFLTLAKKIKRGFGVVAFCVILALQSPAQTDNNKLIGRVGISAGMGVNYHNAQDIVNRINGFNIISERAPEFKSAVEFFGLVSVPLATDWAIKVEYVYLLASYNQSTQGGFGTAEFSYGVHMPTLIGQYILLDAGAYNFKIGLGAGYHLARYKERVALFEGEFTGNGIGTVLDLEGNTALGENLYAHLGTQARWDFIGDLKNGNGQSPTFSTTATTLHFFSVGARLGMTYYF